MEGELMSSNSNVPSAGIGRRTFVKWAAAAASIAAAGGLVESTRALADEPASEVATEPMTGEWKNAACWFDCGGNCVNQAYVEDGIVLCQRTDISGDDTYDAPQQRGCYRGRSMRKLVFGEDRLKYPIRRKHWEPGGGDKSLRGCDEWVRMDWDEALDMAAAEIKRIVDEYGNKAILSSERSGPGRFFNAIGGSTTFWSCWSSGGFYWTSQHMVGGGWPRHALTLSDRYEFLESKLIVLWGHNPVWSSQGNPILNLLEAKRRGAKIIVIDPIYHDTAKVLADEFIGIRPATDAAMLLGLAYTMIDEGIYDQEFLDKYCVGFDADHMPEDATTDENFKDYVLGAYDGIPKTPEWASEICGVDVETIKGLAREMCSVKPMAMTCSRAPSRTSRGDQFAQAFLTVGWMTGNVGTKGAMVGHIVTSNVGSCGNGPWLINTGSNGVPAIPNPVSPYCYYTIDPFDDSDWSTINHSEIWEAVLTGQYHAGVRGVLPIDIHLINHIGRGSTLNQSPATAKGIEAHRKVDFVVASGYHMNTNCRYADIVFPVCTRWEEPGETLAYTKTNRETMLAAEQITEPMFECRTDAWLDEQLGIRMGIDPEVINPVTLEQQGLNRIKGATFTEEDGVTKVPLFTLTQDDLDKHFPGLDAEPQEGKFDYEQFLKDGYVRVDRHEGDNYGYTALKEYIEDPEANPRPTPSGKLEIYCQSLSNWVDAVGFDTKSPIAEYQVPQEGYEETLADWETKEKGEYPFQLVTLHCLRTVHSSFDNVPQIREAGPNNLQMNARDAAELGIQNGDTVLITSKWGKCLRNVDATERIMPGVLKLDEATWPEIDEETGIDHAGACNYLIGDLRSGSGIQAWNSCICKVEKWDGEPLPADCLWPQRVIDVEKEA